MTPSSTPLWLDLRTEYIDDNFEKVVEYLRNANQDDSFYKKTKELFEQRIEQLLEDVSNKPLYADPDDKDTIFKAARMLAVYLLTHSQSAKYSAEAFVALTKMLAALWPNHAKALINKSIERLQHNEVDSLGFTWSDYDKIAQELFIYNLINYSKFSNPIKGIKSLSVYGTLILDKNGLQLCGAPLKEAEKLINSGAKSMDTSLGMTVVTPASDKLKKSQEKDIKAIDKFVKDLKLDFQNTKQSKVPRRYYSNGDEATIIITNIFNKCISVKTIDDNYDPIEGELKINRASIDYYKREDIYSFFTKGDIIKATVSDVNKKVFEFEKQFVDYILKDCEDNDFNEDNYAECIIVNQNSNNSKSHLIWINDYGHPVRTSYDDRFEVGSQAYLSIKDINDEYCTIHGQIVDVPSERNEEFKIKEKQKECFRSFVDFHKGNSNQKKSTVPNETLSTSLASLIVRFLYDYQKTLLKPSERYKNLSLALLIATVVNDTDSVAYIEFAKNYLKSLVAFVNNEPVDELLTSAGSPFATAESTKLRVGIVELLREYGKDSNSQLLNDAIENDNSKISQLAQLIQSANRMKNILTPGVLSVIKHEILKALSIESEKETDFEADSGSYIGIESATMEFKTSVIFAPGNTNIPNESTQNYNIAKTVCAFLNSQAGGTLYIGVNDQGYVVGIDNDMKHLKYHEIDSYIRYIQDMLKDRLGTDAIYYVKIEPAYDGKVVMLHAQPHPYQIVELKGKSYVRINNESRLMPEDMRIELLTEKHKKDKEKAANLSWLHKACQLKKCVILHDYASSNSRIIQDRHIEPFKVLEKDNLVQGFDIDKRVCRVFNIDRINYVELLENEDWGNTSAHHEIEVDAFHLSGGKPMQVSLELDLMARNLLIEEFPRTKEKITVDKKDPNKYYYNDTVRSILGISRFYMGLADHITIIEAPQEFKDTIKRLAQDILSKS